MVKTAASHAANRSSTLLRVTTLLSGDKIQGKKQLILAAKAVKINKVGADCGEGPPVPIPNTAVKLICAENTWLVTAREDR